MSRRRGRPAPHQPQDAAGLSDISALPRHGGDGRDVPRAAPAARASLPAGADLGRNAIGGRQHARRSAWSGRSATCPPPDARRGPAGLGLARRRHRRAGPLARRRALLFPARLRRRGRRRRHRRPGGDVRRGPRGLSASQRAAHRTGGTGPRARPGAWRSATGSAARARCRPRQRIVELVPERPTRLPALVLVRTTGPYAPDDPAEGETVERVEPQPIAPGQPVTITVEASPRGRPGWPASSTPTPPVRTRGPSCFSRRPRRR